jgi:hypothetical protein
MKFWRDSFSASSTLTLADSSSSEECLAVSSESRIEHVMHPEQLSAQKKVKIRISYLEVGSQAAG